MVLDPLVRPQANGEVTYGTNEDYSLTWLVLVGGRGGPQGGSIRQFFHLGFESRKAYRCGVTDSSTAIHEY